MRRIFIAVLAAVVLINPAFGFDRTKEARTVTVTGNGIVHAVPDVARVSVGVVVDGTDVETVTTSTRHIMNAVLAAIKAEGIPETDIQTQYFYVSPKTVWDSVKGAHTVGFIANNQIRITVRDLNRTGRILSVALKAGATDVSGPQFDLSNRASVEHEALKLAVADAKERALLLADSSGSVLGEPLVIQEGTRSFPMPRPFFGAMAAKTAESEPISPGEETITASVTITYALK